MDAAEFRRILGHFSTGVAVVATRDPIQGLPRGLTANAVASVSLDPPLVLACIERDADSHDVIDAFGSFSINILDSAQERLARRFADDDFHDRFSGIAYRDEVTGAPVLDDALAWVDCRLWAAYAGGDHTIFVGEVMAGDARNYGAPLVFYRGGYGRYEP